MPETILPQSLRGLGNALGLSGGGRIGPAGVEFSLPAQPVLDVGAYAAYGSARLDNAAIFDGWVNLALSAVGGGAGVVTSATLNVNSTSIPPMRAGDVLWLYQSSLELEVSVAVADFGSAAVDVSYPSSIGPGSLLRHLMHSAVASEFVVGLTALQGWVGRLSNQPPYPLPVPQGGVLNLRLLQAAAAGTCTVRALLLARILPAGVPPVG